MSARELGALVLEDNAHMRVLLTELLRGMQIERVTPAETLDDARQFLNRAPCGVVLVDIGLEGENGLDLIREIRMDREHPHRRLPMLVVSGQGSRISVQEARDVGADGFLMKPFSSAAFMQNLERVLYARFPYVETDTYFGPDRRRRRRSTDYEGPERRQALEMD